MTKQNEIKMTNAEIVREVAKFIKSGAAVHRLGLRISPNVIEGHPQYIELKIEHLKAILDGYRDIEMCLSINQRTFKEHLESLDRAREICKTWSSDRPDRVFLNGIWEFK